MFRLKHFCFRFSCLILSFFIFIFSVVNSYSVASASASIVDYIIGSGKSVVEYLKMLVDVSALSWGIFTKSPSDVANQIIDRYNITIDNIEDYLYINSDGKIAMTPDFSSTVYNLVVADAVNSNGAYLWRAGGGKKSSVDLGVVNTGLKYYMDTYATSAIYHLEQYGSYVNAYVAFYDGSYIATASSSNNTLQCWEWDKEDKQLYGANHPTITFDASIPSGVTNYWSISDFDSDNDISASSGNIGAEITGSHAVTVNGGVYVRRGIPCFVTRSAAREYVLSFLSGALPVDYDYDSTEETPVTINPDTLSSTDWTVIIPYIVDLLKDRLDVLISDGVEMTPEIYAEIIKAIKDIVKELINNSNGEPITKDDIQGGFTPDLPSSSDSLLEQILSEIKGLRVQLSDLFTDAFDSSVENIENNSVTKSIKVSLKPVFEFNQYIQEFLTIDWDIVYDESVTNITEIWNDVDAESNQYYQDIKENFNTINENTVVPDDEKNKQVNNLTFNFALGKYGNYEFDLSAYASVLATVRFIISVILWVTYGYSVIQKLKPKINID